MKSRYGMEIRAAVAADASGIAELLADGGSAVAVRALTDRVDAIRRGDGTALLALEWGPPSGIVVVHWYRTLWADQPTAQITTLFVGRESRRRGVGRALLKAAAQAARVAGCGALELRAEEADADLAAFCHASGFTQAAQVYVRALRKG
jgi:aminoglycoside 6'-N-acetyltransferase I